MAYDVAPRYQAALQEMTRRLGDLSMRTEDAIAIPCHPPAPRQGGDIGGAGRATQGCEALMCNMTSWLGIRAGTVVRCCCWSCHSCQLNQAVSATRGEKAGRTSWSTAPLMNTCSAPYVFVSVSPKRRSQSIQCSDCENYDAKMVPQASPLRVAHQCCCLRPRASRASARHRLHPTTRCYCSKRSPSRGATWPRPRSPPHPACPTTGSHPGAARSGLRSPSPPHPPPRGRRRPAAAPRGWLHGAAAPPR